MENAAILCFMKQNNGVARRPDSMGDRIRQMRDSEMRVSQKQLARQVGINQNYLSNIELGKAKKPPAYVIAKIAKALKVSLDYLIVEMGVDDPTPHDKRRDEYLSEEADQVAQIIDGMCEEDRKDTLAIVNILKNRNVRQAEEYEVMHKNWLDGVERQAGKQARVEVERVLDLWRSNRFPGAA